MRKQLTIKTTTEQAQVLHDSVKRQISWLKDAQTRQGEYFPGQAQNTATQIQNLESILKRLEKFVF